MGALSASSRPRVPASRAVGEGIVLEKQDGEQLGAVGRRQVRQHVDPGALLGRVEDRAGADEASKVGQGRGAGRLGLAAHELLAAPLEARPPDEKPPERGAATLDRPTVTPDLALTAEPPPVPRAIPLTASTRDGTEIVRAAAVRGELDSIEPVELA